MLTNKHQDVLYVAEGYINYSMPGGWMIVNDGYEWPVCRPVHAAFGLLAPFCCADISPSCSYGCGYEDLVEVIADLHKLGE
jgi:hypothetical protein